jgi:hypothetical protein
LTKHLLPNVPQHLNKSTNKLYVLISKLAGTGLAPSFFDVVLQPILLALGFNEEDYSIIRTRTTQSVIDFARSVLLETANGGGRQTVMMLSGDGGLVDTINGLLESNSRSRYLLNCPFK